MFLVFTENSNAKTYTLKEALEFLDMSGIGDLGGAEEEVKQDEAWYNDGEQCGIEKRDGRELRDVEFAFNVRD